MFFVCFEGFLCLWWRFCLVLGLFEEGFFSSLKEVFRIKREIYSCSGNPSQGDILAVISFLLPFKELPIFVSEYFCLLSDRGNILLNNSVLF